MSDDNTDHPMTPVSSSNVAAIGTQGRDLIVQFTSGKSYAYAGAAEHYDAMAAAPSPGGYLNRQIKNRYSYREV